MKPANTLTHKTGDNFELTIDSLSYSGGRGVGRHEGLVVFVPDTAPGERIRARVTAVKPRYLEAELIEILSPSPHRRAPLCPVFGQCGGCTWQHVTYESQVAQKDAILRMSLKNLAKLTSIEWQKFIPAPAEFYYRNRIQLHVQGGVAGFYSRHSRDLVVIEKCFIADERLNEKIPDLPRVAKNGRIELALRANGDHAVWMTERDPQAVLFGQVNSEQNERLKDLVTGAILFQPQWIMDLYAGSGNLTAPLAEKFPEAHIRAVELSHVSVGLGRHMISGPQLEWFCGDVAQVLKKMTKPSSSEGVVVLDPPRPGCANAVLDEIVHLRPKQIVYVSCNPATFARDMEKLLRARPHDRLSVQGLDMFPQTEHVELVASLCAAP